MSSAPVASAICLPRATASFAWSESSYPTRILRYMVASPLAGSSPRRHGEVEVAQHALRHLVRAAAHEEPGRAAQGERVMGRADRFVGGDRANLLCDGLGGAGKRAIPSNPAEQAPVGHPPKWRAVALADHEDRVDAVGRHRPGGI